MLRSVVQNSTLGFYIFASDSTTPTNGKTGLTITTTLSKAGASANSVSPTITEIGNGLYFVAPIAAHRDTLGEIAWQFSATGAIIAPRLEKVVAVNDQTARFGASDGTSVTLAANQDVRNISGITGVTFPSNFGTLLINASGHVSRVVLVDTCTANSDMRGTDNAALLATALSNATWTNARAGYLDKLNVSGVVASQSDINALNQSASRRVILQAVGQWESPESGSTSYTIELRTFDGDGAEVNADSNPTITVTGQTSGSLAANVGTITNPATGVYRWTYSVSSTATIEPVRIDTSATIGGSSFPMSVYTQVTDFVGVDFTVTDRNNITAIFNKLPSRGFIAGTTNATGAPLPADIGLASANLDTQFTNLSNKIGTPAGSSVSADIASVKNDTGTTIPGLIASASTLVSTLATKVRKYFQLSLRKDAAITTDNATELAEINATGGSGAGTFANTTDAQEAIRDRGDAAWTGGGGSGSESDLMISTTIATLASQTSFTLTQGSTDDDAYNDQLVVITDASTLTQKARSIVAGYVGSTKTITLKTPPTFTIAAGDSVAIIAVGSGGAQSVTLQLGATIPLTLGQVTGLTQDLVVGNSYTQELGTRIPVTLTDTNGDAIDTVFGNRALSDATCTIKCVLHPMNARNTDNVTAAAQGDCEFVPAAGSDPASLWIELPKAQTDKLSPGVYSIQFHAIWDDGETVTIAWKGQAKFMRIIRPKN